MHRGIAPRGKMRFCVILKFQPLTACVKNVDHVCLFLEVWNIEGTQWGMTTVALLSGFLQGAVVDVDHVKKKGTRAMLV